MKTLTRLFACAATSAVIISIVSACSSGSKSSDSAQNRQPAIALDETDTIPAPDQWLAEVHGPVAEVVTTSTYGTWDGETVNVGDNKPYMKYHWYFTPTGAIEKVLAENIDEEEVTNSEGAVTERDKQGNALCFEVKYSDSDNEPLYVKTEHIDWQDGMPVVRNYKDDYTTERHQTKFDESGKAKSHELQMHDGHEGYKQTDTYKYTAFDDHGNWTERYVRSLGVTVYYDGKGNPTGYGDSNRSFTLERRTITYHPNPKSSINPH